MTVFHKIHSFILDNILHTNCSYIVLDESMSLKTEIFLTINIAFIYIHIISNFIYRKTKKQLIKEKKNAFNANRETKPFRHKKENLDKNKIY